MTDNFDVIAAFADGEHVASDALRAALADETGREYLIDVLALRGLVTEAPGSRTVLNPPAPRTTGWRGLAVAAMLVAGVAGGFLMGRQSPVVPAQSPAFPPMVTAQATPPELHIPAPAPTRVIKLETGKSWNERTGGN